MSESASPPNETAASSSSTRRNPSDESTSSPVTSPVANDTANATSSSSTRRSAIISPPPVSDTLITDLKDFIKCPINLETTNDMVFFNKQLYDKEAFYHHKIDASTRNSRLIDSGYERLRCFIKDPRTGENLAFDWAFNHHFFGMNIPITRLMMALIDRTRVGLEVIRVWVPEVSGDSVAINHFVTFVRGKMEGDTTQQSITRPLIPPSIPTLQSSEGGGDSLPHFVNTTTGNGLILSILSAAKCVGFENSLLHGKRTGWISSQLQTWFSDDGILSSYQRCSNAQLRKKIKQAEKHSKRIYDGRSHQADTTGAVDEALPLFVKKFFEYFDWKLNRPVATSTQLREANQRVNRSLIGQQPDLGAAGGSNGNRLLGTTRPSSRASGTGEVASEVTIVELDASGEPATSSSAPSREVAASSSAPSRDVAPNHTNTTRRSRSGRVRRHNTAFPNLPPSGSNERGRMDIDRLHRGYATMASSISSLAMQQRVRRSAEINREIISTVEKKADLESAGASDAIISAYTEMIAGLERERDMASQLDSHLFSTISAFNNNESSDIENSD